MLCSGLKNPYLKSAWLTTCKICKLSPSVMIHYMKFRLVLKKSWLISAQLWGLWWNLRGHGACGQDGTARERSKGTDVLEAVWTFHKDDLWTEDWPNLNRARLFIFMDLFPELFDHIIIHSRVTSVDCQTPLQDRNICSANITVFYTYHKSL